MGNMHVSKPDERESMSLKARFAATGATLALAASGLGLAATTASAAPAPMTPAHTSFVSLSYGPGGVADHQLALDVYGQVNANNTPVVAWESDEYQNVSGRVDPAEQFVTVPVTYGTSAGAAEAPSSAKLTNGYQLRWAPGGILTNKCVTDQSTSPHTWARIEQCAGGAYQEGTTTWLTGSSNQDFFLDRTADNHNTLATYQGYGELESAVNSLTGTGPTFTSATALNDSAYVNGGHVISWKALSSTNEEFKFRPAS